MDASVTETKNQEAKGANITVARAESRGGKASRTHCNRDSNHAFRRHVNVTGSLQMFSFDHFLETGNSAIYLPKLPALQAQFHIPPLADKLQNPIIDTLSTFEGPTLAEKPNEFPQNEPIRQRHLSDIWMKEIELCRPCYVRFYLFVYARSESVIQSSIASWDGLHRSTRQRSSPTPFLSEQTSNVFAAARYL